MSQQSPVAVATQRLLGKQQNVEEQIHALEGHMDALIALEGELEARLQLALSQVDLRLSALMQAVEHKKNQLVLSLKEAVAREKSVCEDYRTKALEIVDKAKKGLNAANQLLSTTKQETFFSSYAAISQLLEEGFVDMLLVTHSQPIEEVSSFATELKMLEVDVAKQLESVQELTIMLGPQELGLRESTEAITEGTSSPEEISREVAIVDCMEDVTFSTKPEGTKNESENDGRHQQADDAGTDADNTTVLIENDANPSDYPTEYSSVLACHVPDTEQSHDATCPLDGNETIKEQPGIDSPEVRIPLIGVMDSITSLCAPVRDLSCLSKSTQLQYLNLSPASQLMVLVTDVTSPSSICAQPYDPALVQLMEDMRTFYDNLAQQGDHGGLLTAPSVGDFCCARFTEDNCWYRARIVTVVEQLITTEDTLTSETPEAWMKVDYVDYGNQEQLPLSHLRPLEPQFCQLPCQALACSIANIQPSTSLQLLSSLSNRNISGGGWLVETCTWLMKLLLGKSVEVSVVYYEDCNAISADIYLSPELLFSPESLANLPVPAQIVASMSQYQHSQVPVSLGSFMVSIGIAQKPAIPDTLPLTPVPSDSRNTSLPIPSCLTSTPLLPQSFMLPLEMPVVQGLTTVCGSSAPTSCVAVLSSTAVLPSATALATRKPKTLPSEYHHLCPSSNDEGTEVKPKEQEDNPQACLGSDCGSVCLSTESSKSSPTSVNQPCDQLFTDAIASPSPLTTNELKPLSIDLGTSSDFPLLMSLIVNPSKFFVYPIQKRSAAEMTALPELLQKHYSDAASCTPLPAKSVTVGALCCAPFPEDDSWCRAMITSIRLEEGDPNSSETPNLECRILYFDYGDTLWIKSSALYVLDRAFLEFPMQCICCSLAEIQPAALILNEPPSQPCSSLEEFNPNSTCSKTSTSSQFSLANNQDSGIDLIPPPNMDEDSNAHASVGVIGPPAVSLQWTPKATALFEELTKDRPLVAAVSVKELKSGSVLQLQSWQTVLEVQLYDTSGDSDLLINRALVEAGVAQSTALEVAVTSPGVQHRMQNWNPMESDFLARRNIIAIDDEDVGSALHGYKSFNRACRFFNTPEGCHRGSKCPFQHLQQGISDQKVEETYTMVPSTLTLPSVGDWVSVVVTAVITPTRFYIQMPCGASSPFTADDSSSEADSESDLPTDFDSLTEEMSRQVYCDRDVIEPHTGEIVAAKFSCDDQWYRARVLDVNDSIIQVCFVDFGHVDWVQESEIRNVKMDFMHLPFQAVECCLAGVELTKEYSKTLQKQKEAKAALTELVMDKALCAHVLWKGWNSILGVELYDTSGPDGDSGLRIKEVLMSRDILSLTTSPLKQEELLGIKKKPKGLTQICLPG